VPDVPDVPVVPDVPSPDKIEPSLEWAFNSDTRVEKTPPPPPPPTLEPPIETPLSTPASSPLSVIPEETEKSPEEILEEATYIDPFAGEIDIPERIKELGREYLKNNILIERESIAWYPNPEFEDGGEWVDYEEWEGDNRELIYQGTEFLEDGGGSETSSVYSASGTPNLGFEEMEEIEPVTETEREAAGEELTSLTKETLALFEAQQINQQDFTDESSSESGISFVPTGSGISIVSSSSSGRSESTFSIGSRRSSSGRSESSISSGSRSPSVKSEKFEVTDEAKEEMVRKSESGFYRSAELYAEAKLKSRKYPPLPNETPEYTKLRLKEQYDLLDFPRLEAEKGGDTENSRRRQARLNERRVFDKVKEKMLVTKSIDINNFGKQARETKMLPNWLEGIMEADWTNVKPKYDVPKDVRPLSNDSLLDVIKRAVDKQLTEITISEELFKQEFGFSPNDYTKFDILYSSLFDLEQLVSLDWKVNVPKIQRKIHMNFMKRGVAKPVDILRGSEALE